MQWSGVRAMADETRERILDAAGSIIRESGPEGLTVEAAAGLAGVSRKTVYNYFKNRYALLGQATAAWVRRTLSALQEISAARDMPFVEKLNAVVARGFAEIRQGGRLLSSGRSVAAGSRFAAVRRELHERLRGFLEGIVRDAVDAGMVRADFDPRRLTLVLMTIIVGLAVQEGYEDEPFSKDTILKESLRAVVAGILTPEGEVAMRGSPIFS